MIGMISFPQDTIRTDFLLLCATTGGYDDYRGGGGGGDAGDGRGLEDGYDEGAGGRGVRAGEPDMRLISVLIPKRGRSGASGACTGCGCWLA